MRIIKKILPAALLTAALTVGGCGYSFSPTPYGLMEDLTVSVPVVTNKSRYGELGPMMTSDIITRLDASSNIRVAEGAPAVLKMEIVNVAVTGGAWQVDDDDDTPRHSASRVVNMTIEAVLERPGPDGQPIMRRQRFSGQRTFLVSESQAQVEMRQVEAFQWLVNDLGQKISQTMFSEF
ncbi:hypothetical protein C4J81_08370 [Deltaproteobacteria bacterium Smac51]|nr:hypothetical protein C4J81_08370 [Deltaproteobacteria bacterium Smac51]